MRIIFFLLQKEFRHIFRNRAILAMAIVMPVVQLLIMPLAANYEVKNINIAVVDNDHSSDSRKLVSDIIASGYFRLVDNGFSFSEAFRYIEKDEADLILEIPRHFEKNLIRENEGQLFVAVNAINGTKANLGAVYLTNIIRNYNNEIRLKFMQQGRFNSIPSIETTNSNLFNPLLDYKIFMVPGILAILVTMIGGFLSCLNIVKEKETGTIEQINVSPVKKHQFILGKLIPFWVLGNIVFTLGLIISWLIYDIIPVGNLIVLYLFIFIYLFAILGFGLLVSTYCNTQQQAMFIMFFFMMIFILMGGLFTSIDSMPWWAQKVALFNPVTHLIDVMRMIILKGSGFEDIIFQISMISAFAVVLNTWAVLNYKKQDDVLYLILRFTIFLSEYFF